VVKRILNQRLNLGQKQRQKPIRHKRFCWYITNVVWSCTSCEAIRL